MNTALTGSRALALGAGLGAAAAIALAAAGWASAAPADGRSAQQAAAAGSGASAAPPAGPRASGRPPRRTLPAAGRVAAASPAPAAGRLAGAPPAPARLSAAARVGRRVAATGSGPETRTASTTPGVATTERVVTIYKGTHFVIPNQWALWVTEDSGSASFTASSTYDLKDEDQYDWNKLAGITFTPWRPDRNSMMVVWRYNLKADVFEVGPFFNVDFGYVFPTPDEIITVPAGETFQFRTDYDGITVTLGNQTVYKARPQELAPNFWTSARVTGWFGGNEVAPRTVSYHLQLD